MENDHTLKNIGLVILGIVALLSLVGLTLLTDASISGEAKAKIKGPMPVISSFDASTSCIDSDGGINTQTAGYVTFIVPQGGNPYTYYQNDQAGGTTVNEWVCEGPKPVMKTISCPQGTTAQVIGTAPNGARTAACVQIPSQKPQPPQPTTQTDVQCPKEMTELSGSLDVSVFCSQLIKHGIDSKTCFINECKNRGGTIKSIPWYSEEPGRSKCGAQKIICQIVPKAPQICTPGTIKCTGQYAETCLNDGTGWNTVRYCSSGSYLCVIRNNAFYCEERTSSPVPTAPQPTAQVAPVLVQAPSPTADYTRQNTGSGLGN